MVHNIADVTPGGGAVALASSRTPACWLTVIAPAANSTDIRIGDSTTGAASGLVLVKGTSITFPPISDDLYLDLALIYAYGTGSDKFSAVYGTH